MAGEKKAKFWAVRRREVPVEGGPPEGGPGRGVRRKVRVQTNNHTTNTNNNNNQHQHQPQQSTTQKWIGQSWLAKWAGKNGLARVRLAKAGHNRDYIASESVLGRSRGAPCAEHTAETAALRPQLCVAPKLPRFMSF